MRVAWFPQTSDLAGNPYWSLLQASLERLGAEFDASPSGAFGRRWLLARRGRVHAVHFHYVQQFYAYESTQARLRWVARFAVNLLAARALGFQTVFTLHNLRPTYPLKPEWVDYLGHWAAANLTGSVIVHDESARALLVQRYGRRRGVYVVHHPSYVGVYPNTISRAEARSRLGYTDGQTVFVFFGGIRPNKGVDGLLSVFRGLPGEDVRLLVVGKPWPPEAYLRSLLEQAGEDARVRVHAEFVPDDEVQVYLNAADAVVLPFREILTSGSALLAMSFGRPVVAPAIGCLPDIVAPEAGVLYEPSDPDALRRALLRCRSLDLAGLGDRARELAARLTYDEMARQTLHVYAQVGIDG